MRFYGEFLPETAHGRRHNAIDLDGKVALVTGELKIGRAIVQQLADNGARLHR